MIAAKITVNPSGVPGNNVAVSLYDLLEVVVPGLLRNKTHSGNVAELHLSIASAGVIYLTHKSGSVSQAIDAGHEFFKSDLAQSTLVLRSPTFNQINLRDVFLAATAADQTMWVTTYSI